MVEAHMITNGPDRSPALWAQNSWAQNSRAQNSRAQNSWAQNSRASDGCRVLAQSIVPDGGVTVVRGRSSGPRLVERRVSGSPDLRSARLWLGTLRRIDRVELVGEGPVPRCLLHGVGHRRPIIRSVQVGTALGLGLLGVPLLIHVEAGVEAGPDTESGGF